jgi:hypothetical protein
VHVGDLCMWLPIKHSKEKTTYAQHSMRGLRKHISPYSKRLRIKSLSKCCPFKDY